MSEIIDTTAGTDSTATTPSSTTGPVEARRVAVVTGGSRGIGGAISARLAAEGFAVAILYAGDIAAAGPTATDLFLDGKTQQQIDSLAGMSPLERLGTPQDIAQAVSFLAGPDGRWINGQVLRVNGGMAR